jgi:hypothetical protein
MPFIRQRNCVTNDQGNRDTQQTFSRTAGHIPQERP